jgi:hypothetical protein
VTDGASIVRSYLDAVAVQDWDGTASCLSDDVLRIGPFGDVYQGRENYLGFLGRLMPTLAGYGMRISRLIECEGTVVAELTETVSADGRPIETPECLVFDLDSEDRIARIAIYIQTPGRST